LSFVNLNSIKYRRY